MLFLVKHVDGRRHRRTGWITAASNKSAMNQAEQEWGPALSMTCLRVDTRPVLRIVPSLREPQGPRP